MCKQLWSALLTSFLVPSFTLAQSSELKEKFEVGVNYSVLRLARGAFIFGPTSVPDVNPRQIRSPMGAGVRTVYNLQKSWSIEAELNVFGEQSVFHQHFEALCCGVGKVMDGTIVELLGGTKVGQRWRRMGIYLRVRPGLLHFSKTLGDCSMDALGFVLCNFDKPRTDFVTDIEIGRCLDAHPFY